MSSGSQTPTTLADDLVTFLDRYYEEAVHRLAQRYPNDQISMAVDWYDLLSYEPDIAEDYLKAPRRIQEHLDEALATYDLPADVDLSGATVRVTGLPDEEVLQVRETRARHIGRYVGIHGQVTKASAVKPFPEELAFECQRCGHLQTIPQGGDGLREPHECAGCERQGPFEVDQEASSFINRQVLRVQEPPHESATGRGEQCDVYVEHDLAGTVEPGDRVDCYGVYELEADDIEDVSHGFDTALDGRALEIEESDYDDIDVEAHRDRIEALASGDVGNPYELLVDSIAPSHYGDEDIKLAIGLQLFGGGRIDRPDGTSERGHSHVLLIGDPGAGKSSLLQEAAHIAPRSIKASGKGASAAGLTASVVNDDFGDTAWNVEAGALVRANGGIACIDEIDKVDEDAVASLHDALESQEVHVNKAGINTKLPAQTALLAAGNPKYGRFDRYEPVAEQIELGPTLLSRFDLIFMVSDEPDAEQDAEIARQMVQSRSIAAKASSEAHDVSDDELDEITPAVDTEVLRAWIAHAKQAVEPALAVDEVEEYIEGYYVDLRQANDGDEDAPVPTTPRTLQAIQRLAEASARVRLSDDVTGEDVRRAIDLIESSMDDVGIDPESGQYDADIVETGTSKSTAERRKVVEETIQKRSAGGSADIEEVVGEVVAEGFEESRVRNALEKLRNQDPAKIVVYEDDGEVIHLDNLGGSY